MDWRDPSYNSGYAVRAEYRPLPNCPALRFGQLRIAATVGGNATVTHKPIGQVDNFLTF